MWHPDPVRGAVWRIKTALHSPGGAPLRLVFRAVTVTQLGLARVLDAGRTPAQSAEQRAEVARRVTMAAKTFQRPSTARRMVRTVRRVFDGRIVIADDSRQPMTSPGRNVEIISMPFNSGVPAGRNAALDAVNTEFVLVSDDDIVFTQASNLASALAYLDAHPEVDIVGFRRVDLPQGRWADHGPNVLFRGAAQPLRPWGEIIGGLPVRHKVAQLYLARTDSIQQVRWDENIRMVDHQDFFSSASGRLLSVVDPQIIAYHARTPFDAEYTAYRNDIAQDMIHLGQKWR